MLAPDTLWFLRAALFFLLAYLLLVRFFREILMISRWRFVLFAICGVLFSLAGICFLNATTSLSFLFRFAPLKNQGTFVSKAYSCEIESLLTSGVISARKGNFECATSYYTHAQEVAGRQAAMIAYLKGVAFMHEGKFKEALSDFRLMIYAFKDFETTVLPNSGRIICELYICLLAEEGQTRANEYLKSVKELSSTPPNNEKARQYVLAFDSPAAEGGEFSQDADKLSRFDRVEIKTLREMRNKVMTNGFNKPAAH